MDLARLTQLLNLYFDGSLTEADKTELERAVIESAEARRCFWDHAALHSLTYEAATLKWANHVETATQPVPLPLAPPATTPSKLHLLWQDWRFGWGLAATAILAAALLGLALGGFFTPDVAVLARAVRAEWAEGTSKPGAGTALKPGRLQLQHGAVQINFHSGAHLVFEGPADIQIISPKKAFCRLGRFHVWVPPQARGFELRSSTLNVVDLGTEFGLSLPPSAPAEVHAFSGRVQLNRTGPAKSALELTQGQAVRVSSNSLDRLPASRLGFLEEADLARWDVPAVRAHHEAWQKAARALDADPTAFLHYTFEDHTSWDPIATNQVRTPAPESHGRIIGCQWTEGRWPGKKALRFDGDGDRVRLRLPQTAKAITCLVWARVDGLPNPFTHSLLTGDSEGPGTMRWTVSNAGEIRMGIANPSTNAEAAWALGKSPPVVTTNLLGKWLMLTCVYDGNTLLHYLNGRQVWKGQVSAPAAVGFGWVEVGNWVATPTHPDFQWAKGRSLTTFFKRDFLGCIDEVAVLGRAMSTNEIQRLYSSGQPLPPPTLASQKPSTAVPR